MREPIARMMYLDQKTRLPVRVAAAAVDEASWRNGEASSPKGSRPVCASELTERPKKGFGVPVGDWLRGPLRDWPEALISEERLRNEGVLDAAAIPGAAHLRTRGEGPRCLWFAVMFQTWLQSSYPG